jgi:hypothetical protein
MQSPQYTIKAPNKSGLKHASSDTTSQNILIKENQTSIVTIPEITKTGESELNETQSPKLPKHTSIIDQIDNSKLDMGLPAPTKNRYKANKYLNEIEEETIEEKKLPVLPKAAVQPTQLQPGLRSTMYKNLYGIQQNSQTSFQKQD